MHVRYYYCINIAHIFEILWGYVLIWYACGDDCGDTKERYVEIFNFRHFHKYIVFTDEGEKMRNKEIKDYINVSVVVDIEWGDTREELF